MNELIQIKHRITGAVLFECELPAEASEWSQARKLGFAVRKAISARANLARADLARAYLADAYLAGANLADAYLAGADLARADLAGADLAGANLAGADLARAYLADAYLAGADLADANLAGANLAGADLAGAYLAGANLAGADLARANLADAPNVPAGIDTAAPETSEQKLSRKERYAQRAARFRVRNPDVPVIEDIDERILGLIDSGKGSLNMSAWHTCETTHCMAGWAVTLAGEKGKALEAEHGPQRAGHMIYTAAIGRTPHFFATNERAVQQMKERIAEKVQP